MPELPEVEGVRIGLEGLIKDAIIEKVDVYWERIISEPKDIDQFKRKLQNQRIHSIKRRGKFLLFNLTDYTMISHLRMEGKYNVVFSAEPITKHTHVVFTLNEGRELRYLDLRKFGRIALVKKGEEFAHPSLAKLGPEPVVSNFLIENWHTSLSKRSKAIKGVLLDQQVVAGVGNIYADEILYKARIHPAHPTNKLDESQRVRLHKAIIEVMEQAIKAGGTTIRSYTNAFGEEGSYQQSLHVYGRTGEKCAQCNSPIEKIKVAGRGTHFCSVCQPDWRGRE